MNQPLVSVVVSSYNRPAMLQAALLSLLDQTYSHLEIIVQDDSTNDECAHIVSALADQRILYTRNQPTLGTLSNLRAGFRKCTGKYFSTLNDDDLYCPDYIAKMIAPLEANSRYALAFADHYIINQDGEIDQSVTSSNSATFGRNALKEGCVPHTLEVSILAKSVPGMFAMFRRSMMDLDDFPDEVSSGYDYWMTYLAVRSGNPIYYNPLKLTSYRVHAASQTSSFMDPYHGLKSLRYSEYMHTRFLADPRLQSIHRPLILRLAQIYSLTGFNWLRLGKRGNALRGFVASSRKQPNLRATVGLLFCIAPSVVLARVLHTKHV